MTQLPFANVNVLDLAWAGVGAFASSYLASFGATVVHVESSSHPGGERTIAPFKDSIPGVNRCGYATQMSFNKYSLALNLNHPKGRELIKRFVPWADIVTEAFSPGVMGRWGLSYGELKKIKSDIIMYHTCMQGQTGPHSQVRGFGFILTGLSGFAHVTGWPDQPPCPIYGPYTDYLSPWLAAVVLIGALNYRNKTGEGQELDQSQLESAQHYLAIPILDLAVNKRELQRQGNRDYNAIPQGAYSCIGDDKWCAISIESQDEWDAFCKAIGSPAWTKDDKFSGPERRRANEDELDKLIPAWTINFTAEEVMWMLQSVGLKCGVVQTPRDLYECPQLKSHSYWWVRDSMDIGPINYLGKPFKLSKAPEVRKWGAPRLGEHTEFVCTKIFGMSDVEFSNLLAEGVLE